MNKFFLFVLICGLVSCTSRKFNQYLQRDGSQVRHGIWVEEYDSDEGKLEAKGKYNNGEKTGTWKTTFKGKKFQKDKIKNGIIKTTLYYPNGKVMEKGQSKTDISSTERHWYYFGDWKYYNEKGKLKKIRKYEKGTSVDSLILLK